MNSSNKKSRMITAAAVAATLAMGAGCCSTRSQAPAPVSYNEPTTEAAGGVGPAYETQTGGMEMTNNQVVIPLQKEQVQIGKQETSAGAVRITKNVTTKTVTEPVQIREETVTVDKVPPGSAPPSGSSSTELNTAFQGGEITIPLTKETPVIQTQVVPNGAVVIQKHETTAPMNVQAQERTEHVEAVPEGNPQNVTISSNLKGSENEAVGGTGPSYGQAAGAGVSTEPITQWSQLNSADPATLNGRTCNLSNAKVQRVVNDQLVTIQGENGSPLYVRMAQPTPGLKPGDTVTLHGTVQAVPPDPTTMGWDPSSAQAIQGQQIYLNVPSLTPAQQ